MQCVHWGDTIPGEFEEQREFSPEMPYTIHIKTFPAEEMVPLHYAKTVEVLLCDGLRGEVLVEGRRFALSGKQVFVAPPHALHSTRVQPCGGKMLVFKVHPDYMRRYIDLENYLEVCGCGMERLAALCPDTGEIFAVIHKLMDLDGDLGRCLPLVMEAFRILAQHPAPPRQSLRGSDRPQTGGLQQAVRWTEENYSRHVTLDEVAADWPDVQFVMCHFGNPFLADAAAVLEKNPNVCADLSGLLEGPVDLDAYFARQRAYVDQLRCWMEYVEDWDKFLFGTDHPAVDVANYVEFIRRLVPEEHHQAVFFQNADRVYRLGLED